LIVPKTLTKGCPGRLPIRGVKHTLPMGNGTKRIKKGGGKLKKRLASDWGGHQVQDRRDQKTFTKRGIVRTKTGTTPEIFPKGGEGGWIVVIFEQKGSASLRSNQPGPRSGPKERV